jgi:hypothetical protein
MTQHNNIYAGSHYAECRVLFITIWNVIMISAVMLNVVMPSVPAPFFRVDSDLACKLVEVSDSDKHSTLL